MSPMKVTLVYADGVIDSYETARDPFQSTSHARLATFVEEASADADEDLENRRVLNVMGLELTPIAGNDANGDQVRSKRIVENKFLSDRVHHGVPSVGKVCEHTEGLKMLIIDGAIVWQGDPGLYLADDNYDDVEYV